MEVLTLIQMAREAGMKLWVEEGVLRASGNRRLERLAKSIAERKHAIIAVLTTEQAGDRGVLHSHQTGDGTETAENVGETRVSSPGITDQDWPSRRNEPVCWGRGQTRRLVGTGFPAITPEAVPDAILATPKTICPACQIGVVLPELRYMTGGRCFQCWEASRR